MATKDYYAILGVTKDATQEEIKKQYRILSKKYHPDKNPDDAEALEKFKDISAAYDIIGDPEKRKKHDLGGMGGFGGFEEGSHESNIYKEFFKQQTRHRSRHAVIYGTNIEVKVKITLEEVLGGVIKKVKLNKLSQCEPCRGTGAKDGTSFTTCRTCGGIGEVGRTEQTAFGFMQTVSTCPSCRGKGKSVSERCTECKGNGSKSKVEDMDVKIPAGAPNGCSFMVQGAGNAPIGGTGINGNLVVVIEEIPHSIFHRDGLNILYEHFVSFSDAVFGTSVTVPTLEGDMKFNTERGMPSGKVFSLKGKGLPSLEGNGPFQKGNLLVKINVFVPKDISDSEKELVMQMKELENFNYKKE